MRDYGWARFCDEWRVVLLFAIWFMLKNSLYFKVLNLDILE